MYHKTRNKKNLRDGGEKKKNTRELRAQVTTEWSVYWVLFLPLSLGTEEISNLKITMDVDKTIPPKSLLVLAKIPKKEKPVKRNILREQPLYSSQASQEKLWLYPQTCQQRLSARFLAFWGRNHVSNTSARVVSAKPRRESQEVKPYQPRLTRWTMATAETMFQP